MTEETKDYVKKQIDTEFSHFRSEQDIKWRNFTEDFILKNKPPITLAQAMNWIFSFIGSLVVVVMFIIFMRADVSNNTSKMDSHEKMQAQETLELKLQMKEILKTVTETNNTVIELKTENNIKSKNEEQINKTKRFFNQN